MKHANRVKMLSFTGGGDPMNFFQMVIGQQIKAEKYSFFMYNFHWSMSRGVAIWDPIIATLAINKQKRELQVSSFITWWLYAWFYWWLYASFKLIFITAKQWFQVILFKQVSLNCIGRCCTQDLPNRPHLVCPSYQHSHFPNTSCFSGLF